MLHETPGGADGFHDAAAHEMLTAVHRSDPHAARAEDFVDHTAPADVHDEVLAALRGRAGDADPADIRGHIEYRVAGAAPGV